MTIGTARVIVADDLRDGADTLCMVLGDYGLEARAAYDGHSVIELAERWQPHAAVLDLGIPSIPGPQVARRLRDMFADGIRLVAYTGWTASHHRDEALDAGFDEVLLKPAEPIAMLAALSLPTMALLAR